MTNNMAFETRSGWPGALETRSQTMSRWVAEAQWWPLSYKFFLVANCWALHVHPIVAAAEKTDWTAIFACGYGRSCVCIYLRRPLRLAVRVPADSDVGFERKREYFLFVTHVVAIWMLRFDSLLAECDIRASSLDRVCSTTSVPVQSHRASTESFCASASACADRRTGGQENALCAWALCSNDREVLQSGGMAY